MANGITQSLLLLFYEVLLVFCEKPTQKNNTLTTQTISFSTSQTNSTHPLETTASVNKMTATEPTNWRALCAELTDALHDLTSLYEGHECELVTRSRTALAQPEPEVVGPSDEEIMGLMPQQMHEDLAAAVRAMAEQEGIDSTPAKGVMRIMLNRHVVDLARAVLARYARPAIEPVPVAERLPGAGDCDANELCWWWCHHYESWQLDHAAHYRHWLPYHALPVPTP